MHSTRLSLSVLGVLCSVCMVSPAAAAVMDARVDLNEIAGTGPTGWNVIATASVTNPLTPYVLNDFHTGGDSGARLGITDAFGDSGVILTSVAWSNPAAPWVDNLALLDYFYLNNTNPTGEMVISELDPISKYRIELLSVRSSSSAVDTAYTINGNYGLVVDGNGTNTANFNAYTDGYQNEQFMLWEDILPDSAGQFTISVSGAENVFFNGLRISAVPEPSSLSLLALGGLAMLGGRGIGRQRRTRRKR